MPLWISFCCCCCSSHVDTDTCLQSTELHPTGSHSRTTKESDDPVTKSLVQAADSSCKKDNPCFKSMAQFGMDPRDYQLITVIGRGSFSAIDIFLAKHRPSGQCVAVKRINLDKCQLKFSIIQHEIKMHRLLKHRNILPSLCSFTHNNEIWMVLPSMEYGSCRDLMHAHFREGLPEMAIAYILQDVAHALEYLHARSIIHRCVKASHILINSNGNVRLSGLRHCLSMMSDGCRVRTVHDFPDYYVYALNWASRELLEQNLSGYDAKSDIYSLGITACELANGVVPFQDMPLTEMLLSKIEGKIPRLLDLMTVPELKDIDVEVVATDADDPLHALASAYRRTFSPLFHEIVEKCLYADPTPRPSVVVFLQHVFFKQLRPKSNPPPLTELLKPLQPITQHTLPQGDVGMESIADALDEVTMETTDWIF